MGNEIVFFTMAAVVFIFVISTCTCVVGLLIGKSTRSGQKMRQSTQLNPKIPNSKIPNSKIPNQYAKFLQSGLFQKSNSQIRKQFGSLLALINKTNDWQKNKFDSPNFHSHRMPVKLQQNDLVHTTKKDAIQNEGSKYSLSSKIQTLPTEKQPTDVTQSKSFVEIRSGNWITVLTDKNVKKDGRGWYFQTSLNEWKIRYVQGSLIGKPNCILEEVAWQSKAGKISYVGSKNWKNDNTYLQGNNRDCIEAKVPQKCVQKFKSACDVKAVEKCPGNNWKGGPLMFGYWGLVHDSDIIDANETIHMTNFEKEITEWEIEFSLSGKHFGGVNRKHQIFNNPNITVHQYNTDALEIEIGNEKQQIQGSVIYVLHVTKMGTSFHKKGGYSTINQDAKLSPFRLWMDEGSIFSSNQDFFESDYMNIQNGDYNLDYHAIYIKFE